jgi:hypothetical protein
MTKEFTMKKLTLGLATLGTFAALTVGLASPALAATPSATFEPAACNVHVNNGGTNVDVNWC